MEGGDKGNDGEGGDKGNDRSRTAVLLGTELRVEDGEVVVYLTGSGRRCQKSTAT